MSSDRLTGVVGVHDAGVVEHDVHASPGLDSLNHGGNVRLLAYVAGDGVDLAGHVRKDLFDLCRTLLQCWKRNVGHQDIRPFPGKENSGFETDATGRVMVSSAILDKEAVK